MNCSKIFVGLLLLRIPASVLYAGDFDTAKVRSACPGIAAWQLSHPDNPMVFSPHPGTNPKLVAKLQTMVEEDQAARAFNPLQINESIFKRIEEIDRRNDRLLRAVVHQYGVPRIALIGTDGMHDFWLLIQHADHDMRLQEMVLKQFADSESGASLSELAYLTDRVRSNQWHPQVYGTQFESINGGPLMPKEIEDMAHLAERREKMGLMPFTDYEYGIKALYAEAPAAPGL